MDKGKIKIYYHRDILYVDIDMICYCKADGCYSQLYLNSGKNYIISKPLKLIENELSQFNFMRCHNSYLVNLKAVERIDISKYIIHQELYQIPISKRKYQDLLYRCKQLEILVDISLIV